MGVRGVDKGKLRPNNQMMSLQSSGRFGDDRLKVGSEKVPLECDLSDS